MLFKEFARMPGDVLSRRQNFELYNLEHMRLVEELKAHQAELENQNEKLRRSESRLSGLSRRFSDLYNFAPVAYITFSSTGEIRELNLKASSSLGTVRSEEVGKPFSAFVVPRSFSAFSQHLKDCLNSFRSVRTTLELMDYDDRIFEAELESIACRDERDGEILIRSMLRDVTEARKSERELKAARDKAEAANVAKSQFLANMSHEMRTPLGVMLGFADLLLDSYGQEDELKEGLDAIRRNGKHLLGLIDDLLDIAKVEAGQMQMELTQVDLKSELNNIVNQFKFKCSEKGIDLEIQASSSLPDQITTDALRFRQILLNILSNALKFTASGSVKVNVFLLPDSALKTQFLCLDITDSGCGITPEQAKLLFKPFAQADVSTSRRFGGTGLGLSLARNLAEALGGSLDLLRSEVDFGSTFRIKLPTGHSYVNHLATEVLNDESQIFKDEQMGSLEGLKVLVVEDAQDNRLIISRFLEHAGASVQCVDDGEKGVEFASSNEYDIVLMDLRLPVMDGYSASSLLREKGCETPIIALSADINENDDEMAKNKDFDAYLSKPINWHKLAGTIVRCRSGRKHLH
ncbi:MAG: PAS domain-containing sensor histidine kinase [Proteobacteria bacterium]|nr:MAG: PAS domain-containing sensor histidine kinase [Pseudomonadota bacterium]